MSRKPKVLEFRTFDKGVITEVNPMSFPEGASIDEMNFEIRPDGTRERRKGLINEGGMNSYTVVGTALDEPDTNVSSFLWENVSGYNNLSLIVVQYGDTIHIYRTTEGSVVAGTLSSHTLEDVVPGTVFDYAVLEGNLTVVYGNGNIMNVSATIDEGTAEPITTSMSPRRLTVRDTFGVPVVHIEKDGSSTPLFDPLYTDLRPTTEGLGGVDGPAARLTSTRSSYSSTSYYSSLTVTMSDGLSDLFGHPVETFTVFTNTGDRIGDSVIKFQSSAPTLGEFTLKNNQTGTLYHFKQTSSREWKTGEAQEQSHWSSNAPGGIDLGQEGSLDIPSSAHVYNLRNQSFAYKRLPKTGDELVDPIDTFILAAGARLPSNADNLNSALYPNTEATNKTVDRFHHEDLIANQIGKIHAPRGHFIIDALDRKGSRLERWKELVAKEGYSVAESEDLPEDSTQGGASTVVEYAGRMWFSGFEEKGGAGAAERLRLESYTMYSQLSNSEGAAYRCYQQGDPTSRDESDVLATDGGVLPLDGAYNIKKMKVLGNYLVVFADNGVWAVSGSDGNLFSPTSQRVNKISDKGCVSAQSVVAVDTTIFYWALDGIYSIGLSEEGGFSSNSLTSTTIQKVFDKIEDAEKRVASGKYAPFEERVTWLCNNRRAASDDATLLQLSLINGAWTRHVVKAGDKDRSLMEQVKTPRFVNKQAEELVHVGGVVVTHEGENVVVTRNKVESVPRTNKWASVEVVNGEMRMSFSTFQGQDFKDWGEVDAKAYLVTGYINADDNHNVKRAPYANFHFMRTENGFEDDGEGDLTPLNQSGCKIQTQWEWSNSEASGRWGRPFQGYRYKRLYMPDDVHDPFDTGFTTIVTRNKLRGKGRVLSLKLETEPEKDCKLLGWTMEMM